MELVNNNDNDNNNNNNFIPSSCHTVARKIILTAACVSCSWSETSGETFCIVSGILALRSDND